jgi:hypothetical protein
MRGNQRKPYLGDLQRVPRRAVDHRATEFSEPAIVGRDLSTHLSYRPTIKALRPIRR